jgi:hypothetical protein
VNQKRYRIFSFTVPHGGQREIFLKTKLLLKRYNGTHTILKTINSIKMLQETRKSKLFINSLKAKKKKKKKKEIYYILYNFDIFKSLSRPNGVGP